jgi:predicted metal-binding membrane protein
MAAALSIPVFRRDRLALLVSLGAIVAVCWVYLLGGAGMEMGVMDMGGGEIMVMRPEWTPVYVLRVLAMWSVMMAAMMLPSAAPALLEAVRFTGRRSVAGAAALSFIIGYLAVWACFAAAGTASQWGLDAGGLLSESMAIGDTRIASGLLIAAGLYQLTPWKQYFLRHCRASPGCAAPDGRTSAKKALGHGLRYGLSCLGCCWALMVLTLVGGAMNILWMAAITLWVLAEKSWRFGSHLARLAGIGLVACGGAWLVATGI